MKKKTGFVLWLIFVIAVGVRFLWFLESTYFGFDEARDAFISQDIYLKGDLKLIGPPATGNLGLFHGVLFWYLLGPIYLLGRGDVFFVSAVLRLVNALGVFPVYYIGRSLFSPWVGLIGALFYAVSFEQSQYAMYVGNPTLGVGMWLLIFVGVALVLTRNRFTELAPALMLVSAAAATQLNLMFGYFFVPVGVLLIALRKRILWSKKAIGVAVIAPVLVLSTYLAGEASRGFASTKKAVELIGSGWAIMSPGQTKTAMYWEKFRDLFHDNLLAFPRGGVLISLLALAVTLLLVNYARKELAARLVLVWIFAWVFLAFLGGHLAYYTHAGLGTGLLIGVAFLLDKLRQKAAWLTYLLVLVVIISNLWLIKDQARKSLIFQIKPQPDMRLVDELAVIDSMYQEANGRGFTVRLTGIPYRIQTVWAYLIRQYAFPKWNYYPFWESGNILGFPGFLPPPVSGTTCLRFLVREPLKGLPIEIIDADVRSENIFSSPISRKEIGWFILESRLAVDPECHDLKPVM